MVTSSPELTRLVVQIVTSYLSRNRLDASEIPSLIRSVTESMAGLGQSATDLADDRPQAPAVAIRKSVTPDFIVCLEDGRRLKMLKRYLRTTYGLTPEAYRAKWGLPPDYPMVAPSYAERRSAWAIEFGLGKGGRGRGRAKKSAGK